MKEAKTAVVKAMELLLAGPRTSAELREKLIKAGYGEEETDAALEYVSSFGYVNDEAYARDYVEIMSKQKGLSAIRSELKKKGVSAEYIEAACSGADPDEEETIRRLLEKKAGPPHPVDVGEYRRLTGFFARRGFSFGDIGRVLREYDELGKKTDR